MYPDTANHAPTIGAVEVHQPTPITPLAVPAPTPVVVQPNGIPAVASIVLPDGRIVTGYAVASVQPEPIAAKPAISRAAVNIALGGVGFLAVCGGLLLLTSFIAALAALIQQLIIFAAVIFGGFIAIQVFRGNDHGSKGGNTFHIRKAVFKRNHFNG
ncbi:hypothetical protein [Streptomyces sp. NPDC086777]|uniref:hypothetical protein n=1 Tax=Streptomyces sp. NPDC086777 TaxID=3154866 RepID=UPI00344CABE1